MCLAETGNDVTCVDCDEQKVAQLILKARFPSMSRGWPNWCRGTSRQGRLHFTTRLGGSGGGG